MRTSSFWTPERVQQLIVLWNNRVLLNHMAEKLETSIGSVQRKVRKLELPPRRKSQRNSEASAPGSSHKHSPFRTQDANQKRWCSSDTAFLREHWKKLPLDDIAARSGFSPEEVLNMARHHGLPPSTVHRAPSHTPDKVFETCQWPIGDPRNPDFHFCGKPVVAGKPYCQPHCDRAYVPGSRIRASRLL